MSYPPNQGAWLTSHNTPMTPPPTPEKSHDHTHRKSRESGSCNEPDDKSFQRASSKATSEPEVRTATLTREPKANARIRKDESRHESRSEAEQAGKQAAMATRASTMQTIAIVQAANKKTHRSKRDRLKQQRSQRTPASYTKRDAPPPSLRPGQETLPNAVTSEPRSQVNPSSDSTFSPQNTVDDAIERHSNSPTRNDKQSRTSHPPKSPGPNAQPPAPKTPTRSPLPGHVHRLPRTKAAISSTPTRPQPPPCTPSIPEILHPEDIPTTTTTSGCAVPTPHIAALHFLHAMQTEQSALLSQTSALEQHLQNLQTASSTTSSTTPSTTPSTTISSLQVQLEDAALKVVDIERVEKALAITSALCFELYIAEYAFRDELDSCLADIPAHCDREKGEGWRNEEGGGGGTARGDSEDVHEDGNGDENWEGVRREGDGVLEERLEELRGVVGRLVEEYDQEMGGLGLEDLI